MKIIQFIICISLTTGLIILLNRPIGIAPPIGKFLSPFIGFWQNAETSHRMVKSAMALDNIKAGCKIKIDDKRIPHLFAQNNADLYFLQGYQVASDRLWQMEFISYVASGRVSEIVGKRALEFDRTQRRIGLTFGAQNSMKLLHTDTLASSILHAYSAGVNAYIQSLHYKDLPIEYKIMNYAPEEWTPFKCVILLKFMAKMLTGKEYDFEYTNALKLLGRETFDLLFPDFPDVADPVIPVSVNYDYHPDTIPAPPTVVPESFLSQAPFDEPSENNGSNNWAVSGRKSTTGSPILCNDPHLRLQIPSIWYQMQLHSPDVNVYGVTIPGAPGIVIGFNENIAWGVTNASVDVKDWYKIEFQDDSRNAYLYDGQWLPSSKVIEEIKIKGEPSFLDTVIYTHYGPVAYDRSFSEHRSFAPMALKWTAHNPSNELKTFYLLNRAKNYHDYEEALRFYECPGQNFAFAAADGDIAIRQQGKFVHKWKEQGKFLMDGTHSAYEWKDFIPFEHNPHVLNPERGFVSSANQHPTDTTYPYYYNGIFEYYRNRRINHLLSSKEKFSPDDMKHMQNDNFNLMAQEILPFLLANIEVGQLDEKESAAFSELSKWNFMDDKDLVAPSYFEAFWNHLYDNLWDEFEGNEKMDLTPPDYYNTVSFLIGQPGHPLIDNRKTPEVEDEKTLIHQSFRESVKVVQHWIDSTQRTPTWADFKGTYLNHWANIAAFSVIGIPIGGNLHIINATSATHGASWRMIVALGKEPEAWGIYPGGQSGNPGSPYYDNFVASWAAGEYNPLLFMKDENSSSDKIIFTQTFNKK